MGKSLLDYGSMVALTHFKGHVMGGFGRANKNIGIGCAEGRIGMPRHIWFPNMEPGPWEWEVSRHRLRRGNLEIGIPVLTITSKSSRKTG